MEKLGLYFAEVGLNADRLETFGFRYKLADAPWQEHVAPLLSTFASQYPHEILPEDFVIPAKDSWPQQFWGLRLGKIFMWSSRYVWNHNYGAKWTEREMPENTSLAGEYGYCRVASSFRVPSELPWPKQMWGLRMKTYLRQMNQSGDLFIPGGLQRAMMNEQQFGFVFKLATEVSCGMPQRDEYRADEEQIERINVESEEEEEVEPERLLGKQQLPSAFCKKREGWVGSYSPKARKARVERFLKKRQERVWVKEVKYDVRKSFADTRLRVKGRFVTREDEKTMRELLSFT